MYQLPNLNIYIGGISDLSDVNNDDWAIVHATQTIHYEIMGWNRKTNKPDKDDPNYIIFQQDNRLFLNWVDGGAHLYNPSGPETFIKILDFIDNWIEKKQIFIHCDQGMSRAPTLALLYLAKRKIIQPTKIRPDLANFFFNWLD